MYHARPVISCVKVLLSMNQYYYLLHILQHSPIDRISKDSTTSELTFLSICLSSICWTLSVSPPFEITHKTPDSWLAAQARKR